MLFLTDPDRTPEPGLQAARLPEGAGVVFRWFGRPDSLDVGQRLASICRVRGLTFLVGADADLAEALDADGLHLPERLVADATALKRRPGWLMTGASHSTEALAAAAKVGLDAALLSPVFASESRSAGAPLGAACFTALATNAGLPVYALGGVTATTGPTMATSGACGLAVVGAV